MKEVKKENTKHSILKLLNQIKKIIMHPIFQWIFWFILVVTFIPMMILGIGGFGYKGLAVVSNSMVPVFSKGDMIIVKKLSDEDKANLKKGDIIQYIYSDKATIIHEIFEIGAKPDGTRVYVTKGRNNEEIDKWYITDDLIMTIYQLKIPFVAWPTVWVNKLGILKWTIPIAMTLWPFFKKDKEIETVKKVKKKIMK